MENTWPGGFRHAMTPDQHEAWNATNTPGTKQLCCECESETDRCEDDSMYLENGTGPLCETCYKKATLDGAA